MPLHTFLSVIHHRRDAAFFSEYFKEVVVAAETAQLTNISDRDSLKQIFFAQVDARTCDIRVQGDSCTLFKFSGNVFTGNKNSRSNVFKERYSVR